MELEGSLDVFRLPDVLALLAMTRTSGVLRLTRAGEEPAEVTVRAGQVAAAAAGGGRHALVRRAVAVGLLDGVALERVVDAATGGGAELGAGDLLVEVGGVDAAALVPLARAQVDDAVFALLRWPDGGFAFSAGDVAADAGDVGAAVEDVVAEARRRLDTWPSLAARVPGLGTVVALVPDPPAEPTCDRREWALMSRVDGRRSIADLVAASGGSEWEVLTQVAALVTRGLLAPLPDPSAAGRRAALLARLDGATAEDHPAVLETPPAPAPAPAAPPESAPHPYQQETTDTAPTEPATEAQPVVEPLPVEPLLAEPPAAEPPVVGFASWTGPSEDAPTERVLVLQVQAAGAA